MSNLYRFGQFVLDPGRRTLSRADSPVSLTPRAFDVLLFLAQNPNRLVTKEELLQAVWGDTFVEEGNLTQYISHLRKALGDNSEDTRLIVTIARKGYQFTARVLSPMQQTPQKMPRFRLLRAEPQKPMRDPRSSQPGESYQITVTSSPLAQMDSRPPRCWPLSLRPSGCTGVTAAE